MKLFDLFKKNRKSKIEKQDRNETPSDHELSFAQAILGIIGPAVEEYGFELYSKKIKKYSTTIIWRKDKQYIKVNSTTYPLDGYYYNVILGEGSSDDFFEYDWNSVAIWALARVIKPDTDVVSYDFPYNDNIKPSIQIALKHLLTYGQTFLEGDLTTFQAARKMINENREPYKIHSPDKNGEYKTTDEPISVEQKKKYS